MPYVRGHFSRHKRHLDGQQQQQRQQDEGQHHHQPQQRQQEEETSIAREIRQFMAEMRDVFGNRRLEEEQPK